MDHKLSNSNDDMNREELSQEEYSEYSEKAHRFPLSVQNTLPQIAQRDDLI